MIPLVPSFASGRWLVLILSTSQNPPAGDALGEA